MERLVVIATGGTISSQPRGRGLAATLGGADVIASVRTTAGTPIEVLDLCTVDSSCLTLDHQLALLHRVRSALADPAVRGIVVTHGTDTLEESAFLLDLHHDDSRPVVFTGSQLPLGHPDSDAPGNLADAFLVASQASGRGVLIVFDGHVYPARGTVKRHTTDPHAFEDPSGSAIGRVIGGSLVLRPPASGPVRPAPLPAPSGDQPRVDVITHHSGGDSMLFEAALAAGARGIVLVGTGAGNATPDLVRAVAKATAAGVVVALTTRCAAGPVLPIYASGGGAVDLLEAGAVPAGTLRASQTRIALLSALMAGADSREARRMLPALLGTAPR